MYLPNVITPPTIEPCSLADLKAHIRVTHSNDDTLIAFYGKAAREYVESRTGRTMFKTTYEVVRDRFPGAPGGLAWSSFINLPRAAPLTSVTSVKYTDSSGAVTTWDPANYIVNTDAMPGVISPVYGGTWPSYTPQPTASVRIRYVAGLSDTASPLVYPDEGLIAIIKLLVEGMYNFRGPVAVPEERGQTSAVVNQYGVEALLAQYQVAYEF